MLLSILFGVAFLIVNVIWLLIPQLPSLPDSILNTLSSGVGLLIDNGLSIVSLFIDYNIFKVCVGVAIAIVVAEPFYYIVMWLLRKIPFINIK